MIEAPLKILIVEDNDSDVELIVREIKKGRFKFTHRHCEEKKEYEKLLIDFEPDVILSDHNLPSFSSVDALITARQFKHHIPFILVSGFIGEDEAVDMIVNKGANDFILKDNLLRLNPAIVREFNSYKLKFELQQKSEQLKRLSMVASHTHNGVVIANKEGKIEWVNQAYTDRTGYKLNECYGQKPGHLVQGPDTDPKTVARIRSKLKKEIPFREEILNYHKNGTPYWVKLEVTPIKDGFGELTNFIAIQEDITERKDFEHKLLDSNSRLEKAQIVGEIGDWDFDLKTKEVTWSNQVFSIYDRKISLGPPSFEELKEYHPNDELASSIIENALSKGKSYDLDTELISHEGVKKYIRTVGVPIRLDGELIEFSGVVQDITARKKIELALTENQEKLKSITDNLPGILLRYKLYSNGDEEVEYISEAVEKIYEVKQSVALRDCSKLWSLIVEEDVKDSSASIRKSAETMTTWDHIYRIITKSGKLKWIHAVGEPRIKTNEYVIWDTMLLEITKEKEFETSLIEANARLLDAQKLAKIGDWSVDFITNETYISPMVKEIHEVEPESDWDIEKGLSFFKEGFDREKKKEIVERAIRNGIPYNEELRIVTANGTEKWVRTIGEAILKQGKCIRLYGTIMDITDERHLSDSLEVNRNRLNAAIKGADLGVWDADIIKKTNTANKEWFQMLGYEPEEIEDSYAFFFSLVHPDDISLLTNALTLIEEGKEDKFELILRVKAKDGEYRVILDKARVVENNPDENILRLIGTHLDITDQFNLQKKLEQSLDEKTILLSEVHHRVKNNLAIVSGLLELEAMESEDHATIDSLTDTAKRIKSIAGVHELLYDSQNFSEISFKTYTTNLFESLALTISRDSNIDIDIDIEENLEVNINQAVPLGLLINELVTNSFKYAFKNVQNPKIHFKISFDGELYKATYFDNGQGFNRKEFDTPTSLGFTLVKTLLAQLDAEFRLNTNDQFKLTFKFRKKVLGAHSNI